MSAHRRLEIRQVDVFTPTPLAGNPLAVVLDASGLADEEMQAVAREMNLSETTCVLPPTEPGATYRMRIFTPEMEIPFAGHPSVGTAFVLAEEGRFPLSEPTTLVRQQIALGVLPIELEVRDGRVARVVMTQGEPSLGETVPPADWAAALGVVPEAITSTGLPARVASTGLRQLMVPLADLATVRGTRPDMAKLREICAGAGITTVSVFCRETVDPAAQMHVRVFAPAAGVPEDPATGSAAGALGVYLAEYGVLPGNGTLATFVIEQGLEMGRPSTIWVEVRREGGRVSSVRVGGNCVTVMKGVMTIE